VAWVDENLSIGTRGWISKAWQAFYPEGLPSDWQLDYYSQYFNGVLVPENQWRAWTDDQMIDVAEALDGEGFAFFFEVEHRLDHEGCQRLIQIKSILKTLAVGLLLKGESQSLPETLDDYHVTLFSETNFLPGWHWQFDGQICSGYPLGYLLNLPSEGKLQASCLQSLMDSLSSSKQQKAYLFIGDDQVSIESIQNLKIISEVMGF